MIPVLNVLPQQLYITVTYLGDLAVTKWLSLIDSTFNINNPCVMGSITAAPADAAHSGSLQSVSGTHAVVIPQEVLLSGSNLYSVCYAEVDGSIFDTSWRYTGIQVRTTLIESISSHSVQHRTFGQIAAHSSLQLVYGGILAMYKWLSIVDSSLNGNNPCALGTVAGSASDTTHSGPLRGGAFTKIVQVDTTQLLKTSSFAVCYTEAVGDTTASWIDSGLRLTISKVSSLQYGTPSRSMTSANIAAATNRLPQAINMVVTYLGDLGRQKWLSLVDSTLTGLNGNDPCVSSAVAAAGADSAHSGPLQATMGTTVVTVPQTVALLSAAKTYAVCYAEVDGSSNDVTWSDSYVRLQMTKIQSLSHIEVTTQTVGHIQPHPNIILFLITTHALTCIII